MPDSTMPTTQATDSPLDFEAIHALAVELAKVSISENPGLVLADDDALVREAIESGNAYDDGPGIYGPEGIVFRCFLAQALRSEIDAIEDFVEETEEEDDSAETERHISLVAFGWIR